MSDTLPVERVSVISGGHVQCPVWLQANVLLNFFTLQLSLLFQSCAVLLSCWVMVSPGGWGLAQP